MLLFDITFSRDLRRANRAGRIVGFLIGAVLPTLSQEVFAGMVVFATCHCGIQLLQQKFCWQFANVVFSGAISFGLVNLWKYWDVIKSAPKWCCLATPTFWWEAGGFFPFVCVLCSWWTLGIIERQYFFAMVLAFFILNFWKLRDGIFAFYAFFYTLGGVFCLQFGFKIVKAQKGDDRRGLVLGVFIVLAMLSSLATLLGLGAVGRWTMCWRKEEATAAAWIVQNTAKDAMFFYEPRVLHFVAALAGRQTYFGAPEVMIKEGFDYGERAAEMKEWVKTCKGAVPFEYIVRNKESITDPFYKASEVLWKPVYVQGKFVIYRKQN
jgi:hypothetical protein